MPAVITLSKARSMMVAAAHVADRREVGIGHAGQLEARGRLEDDARNDQSMQQSTLGASGDRLDKLLRSTSMKLVSDSVNGLTSDLQSAARRCRGLLGHAVATPASQVRDGRVVLRFLLFAFRQAPYY